MSARGTYNAGECKEGEDAVALFSSKLREVEGNLAALLELTQHQNKAEARDLSANHDDLMCS